MNKLIIFSAGISLVFLIPILLSGTEAMAGSQGSRPNNYATLTALFQDLRALESPATPEGIPDFSPASLQSMRTHLSEFESRLASIDTAGWRLEQKIDYELVRAEMNGMDYYLRVLQPWARDPAYYVLIWTEQSDTPSHEGPVCPGAIELWHYTFPLTRQDAAKLTAQLKIIPPLLKQARTNLTGNARDLWLEGVSSIRTQAADLDDLAKRTSDAGPEFTKSLDEAKSATISFADWLEKQAASKTGPSGVGKADYSWYLRNVLLVPMSWEDEEMLLKRELARAYASLELERQHNRNLPQIEAVTNPEEYEQRADKSASKLMQFLKKNEILPLQDYMEPELRKHLGSYQPEERRNFFLKIMHLDPTVLYTHFVHWFDIARQNAEPHPSPVRRDPLPFNIWMSRSEGLATSVEEMFMHAGLYDDSPRSRELVWIMLAQRCARGLASLYAHANEISLHEARQYQIRWTPAGWVGDTSLVGFEQHLYLRQPGYGTSYVTGKQLIDQLMMDRSRQLGDKFRLIGFFDEMYRCGTIPVSLIRWQITGER